MFKEEDKGLCTDRRGCVRKMHKLMGKAARWKKLVQYGLRYCEGAARYPEKLTMVAVPWCDCPVRYLAVV
jgi:hypothetical protein